MQSYLYEGVVSHRRYRPTEHNFKYRLYMAYLDLSEFDRAQPNALIKQERFASASYLRADHYGNSRQPLAESIKELIRSETGLSVDGPIGLLTQLRTWGYYFSPLNIYYCFQADEVTLAAVVAEVSNTPWMEQHLYVLWQGNQLQSARRLEYSHPKAFHVSPFMAMDHIYTWSIEMPHDSLRIGIHSTHREQLLFAAELSLRRQELNRSSLRRMQIRYPLLTLQTVLAIYHQAFRLWKKKCPFYPHPKKCTKL